MEWIDLAQQRQVIVSCEHSNESTGFHKLWETSRLALELLASLEELSYVESVSSSL